MRYCILIIAVVFVSIGLSAQDRSTYRWYFGNGLGLSFLTTPPTVLTDGQTRHIEGTSAVSDPVTGTLCFYTDGNNVWNRNHDAMATSLNPQYYSSTQSTLIVRQPNSSTLYHLFTTEGYERRASGIGRHFVIDMTRNSGLGGVVATDTTFTSYPVSEKLTACKACNQVDYWIIFRTKGSNNSGFLAFRLTPSGVDPKPVFSPVSDSIPLYDRSNRGEIKVSPDGRFLVSGTDGGTLDVYDFNNSTGEVTNRRILDRSTSRYGLSFSPSNRWLYVNNGWVGTGGDSVFRYDMTLASIASSRQTIYADVDAPNGLGCMVLAPDGKMYIARVRVMALAAVTNPDAADPAQVGFMPSAITFSAESTWGLPNFPQDLFLADVAGADVTTCPNQPVRLGIPPLAGYSYRWSPSNGLNDSTLSEPMATVATTTTYFVTATDARGCQFTRDVTVNVRPRPNIRLTRSSVGGREYCAGEKVTIGAELAGARSFTWQPGNVQGAIQEVYPQTTQTYTVSVIDSNGCSWLDSIVVKVNPRPTVRITSTSPRINDTVRSCSGVSVVLAAPEGLAGYFWNTGERSLKISVLKPGMYTVEGIDSNQCFNRDTVVVEFLPNPVADAGRDTSICLGNIARLGARGGLSFRWTPLNGSPPLDRNDVATPTVTFMKAGDFDYAVQATDVNGCSDDDTVRIRVNALPTPTILPAVSDTAICACGSLTLSVSGAQSIEWYRSSPDQVIGKGLSLVVRDSGTYGVRVSDTNGCFGISAPINVRILPQQLDMVVRVPDSAEAGAAVTVEIQSTYLNTAILASCPPDSFTVYLSMGRHALASSGGASAGTVANDLRRVTVSDIVRGSASNIIRLPYVATLGSTDTSIIQIDSVAWKSCPVSVRSVSDTFHLAGVCTARGVKRLFNEVGVLSIMVRPNPASVTTTVVLDASQPMTACNVFVTDVLGRTVAEIFNGDVGKGRHEFGLDCSKLPDGVYSLVTRQANGEQKSVVMEVRK